MLFKLFNFYLIKIPLTHSLWLITISQKPHGLKAWNFAQILVTQPIRALRKDVLLLTT